MSLSEGQKKNIHDALSHLFEDLSQDKLALLKQAFTSQIPADHPFYWLRECWLNPTQYFQSLEKMGSPDLTIGTVQEYILDFANEQIKNHGFKAPLDKQAILNDELLKKNFTNRYVSQNRFVDSEDIWQLPPLYGKIYSCRIRTQNEPLASPNQNLDPIVQKAEDIFSSSSSEGVDEEAEMLNNNMVEDAAKPSICIAFVDLVVQFESHTIQHTIRLKEIPEVFENDLEAFKFEKATKNEALEQALDYAANFALDYLDGKNPDISFYRTLGISFYTKDILTTTYYFNKLKERKIRFFDMANADKKEAKNLNHPNVIALIEAGILSLQEARSLTPSQRLIIANSVYRRLFLERKINLVDTKNIRKHRRNFLLHPHVTHLIENGKLTFKEVMELPLHLKNLLASTVYTSYFAKNPISWNKVKTFTELQVDLLLEPSFAKFILREQLGFSEVVFFTPEANNLIKENPNLPDGEILFKLYADAYAERLFTAMLGQATVLGTIENTDEIFSQLEAVANQLSLPLQILQEKVLQKIINHIKSYIENKTNDFDLFLNHLKKYEAIENPDVYAMLTELILLAQETLINFSRLKYSQSSSSSSVSESYNLLFRETKKRKLNNTNSELKIFCTNLLELCNIANRARQFSYGFKMN